jgi:hypothetical protein
MCAEYTSSRGMAISIWISKDVSGSLNDVQSHHRAFTTALPSGAGGGVSKQLQKSYRGTKTPEE